MPEVACGGHQIQLRATTDLALVLIAASHGISKGAVVVEAGLASHEEV